MTSCHLPERIVEKSRMKKVTSDEAEAREVLTGGS
jgi:hypothetical protein